MRGICIAVLSAAFLAGCALPVNKQIETERMTVAKAQSQIKIGMSSSEVVEVLGSPNMVTTDRERRETWVYDKVSTSVHAASNTAGVWLLVFGASGNEAATVQTQRTLTIIVKFDEKGLVRDFSYRSSVF